MSRPAPSPVQQRVSEAEWQVRVDLAACYRLVAKLGMSDLIYNHITAKVPGQDGHFLINPFGMLYSEITASCFYTLDYDGNVVDKPDTPFAVNQAGFVIHSAVHKARPDLHCVMHTHTRAGMAVSTMKEGLLPLTQTAMRFYGAIGYHDYEVPTADISERERLAKDLGTHNAIILRNHGLVACGSSVPAAFNLMYWLETACKVQVDALGMGRELNMPSDDLAKRMASRYSPGGPNIHKFTALEWQAMRRMLDKEDPSYQD
ncbi:class II aldolase/adducin family protein [Comamonas sp. J-3]|uniref:class II aldolase/adducin family protein n=1 Tax=Comamonas trifloxystrobinivorans TaxID=3350256 RepID=UPI0037286651